MDIDARSKQKQYNREYMRAYRKRKRKESTNDKNAPKRAKTNAERKREYRKRQLLAQNANLIRKANAEYMREYRRRRAKQQMAVGLCSVDTIAPNMEMIKTEPDLDTQFDSAIDEDHTNVLDPICMVKCEVKEEPVDFTTVKEEVTSEEHGEQNDICEDPLRIDYQDYKQDVHKQSSSLQPSVPSTKVYIGHIDPVTANILPEKKCSSGLIRNASNLQCKLCPTVLPSRRELKRHKQVHYKPYKCNICEKGFLGMSHLIEHQANVHNLNVKTFACEICGKKFATQWYRKYHYRLHMRVQEPYKCRICNQDFRRIDDFTMHQRLHTRDKPYACEVCKRKFSREETLKKHSYIHTGEEYYRCKICNKLYYTPGYFARHQRTHKKAKDPTEESK